MTRTIEVEIDESGTVHPMDPATSIPHGRALLILQTDPDIETASLAETAHSVDWRRSEENWPVPKRSMIILENGLPFFPANGRILTSEMVQATQEDEIG